MADAPLNWLDIDLFDFKGNGPRFVLAGEHDGTFTVMDQLTQTPAIWNDQMLFGLTFDQADDLVETMNQILMDIAQA
jgi:hypothetical protein